jgi:hypothetical protein
MPHFFFLFGKKKGSVLQTASALLFEGPPDYFHFAGLLLLKNILRRQRIQSVQTENKMGKKNPVFFETRGCSQLCEAEVRIKCGN